VKPFRAVACLLWIAVLLIAVRYWIAWEHLPPKLITGFDPEDLQRPIAYATRNRSLLTGLSTTAAIAGIGSLVSNLVPKRRRPDVVSWIGLLALYGTIGVVLGSQEVLLESQGVGLSMSRRMALEFAIPMATPFAMVFLSLFIGWKLWSWLLALND